MKTAGKTESEKSKSIWYSNKFLLSLIVAFNLFLYGRVLRFFFFSDDFHHLFANRDISLLDAFSYRLQTFSNPNLYRPTTNIFYSLNEKYFGTNPLPFLLELLLIVIVTAVVLYLLLYQVTKNKGASLLGALLFSALPSHTDPVTWSANVCDTLLALSVVCSIYFLIIYIDNKKLLYFILSMLFVAVALLSKEPAVGIIIPAGFVIVFRRDKAVGIVRRFTEVFIYSLPFAAYFINRYLYTQFIRKNWLIEIYKMPEISGYKKYVTTIFILSSKMFLIPDRFTQEVKYGAVIIIWSVILGLLFVVKNKFYYLLGLIIAISLILPSITVVYYFDRYIYASSIGVAIIASILITSFKNKYSKAIVLAVVVFTTVGLSAITIERINLAQTATDHSRKFVDALSDEKIKDVALVPYYLHSKIFGLWDINQLIVTELNPEMAMSAQRDKELKKVIESADLVTADGIGIVIAGKIMNMAIPERVTGIDLCYKIFEIANKQKNKIYLLGTTNDIIEKAAKKIQKDYKGLKVVGYHHGYFDEKQSEKIIKDINEKGAEIVLVGMGSPMQEKWIFENRERLNTLCLGVGGSFDVLSGEIKRAPEWTHTIGIEWLYRTIQQPKRIKRVLFNLPIFVLKVAKERFTVRSN